MFRVLLPLTLTAALTLAACGGGDSSSSPDAGTPEAPLTGPVAVSMNRLKFEPADVVVKAGARIVWTNKENVPHDVAAREGADFKSKVFGQDGTYEYKTESAGKIDYVCTLHPGMDGTITVVG